MLGREGDDGWGVRVGGKGDAGWEGEAGWIRCVYAGRGG